MNSKYFTIPTTFATIPIGGEFIEVLTDCNEVATRIGPATHQDKLVNAQRVGGKKIFIASWEPVFVREYEDLSDLYWECPDCDGYNSISIDDCLYCKRSTASTYGEN